MDPNLLGRRGSEGGESAIWEINLAKNLSSFQLIAFTKKSRQPQRKAKSNVIFFSIYEDLFVDSGTPYGQMW